MEGPLGRAGMEVMRKRRTRIRPNSSRRQKHSDDRINELPDSILGHILSLLPTKNAVATSILSKRWKFLWTTAINLDFCCPKNYSGSIEKFVQFVNYVLLFHKPGYFNRLSLTWETGCIPFYVNTWISAAVARDVSELFVSVEISKLPIQMQTCMFSSERLECLELECSVCISPEIVFSLPKLESLRLISIYFQSEEVVCKLLKGCPVLNDLVIHMDIGKMIKYRHVDPGDGTTFKCIISSPLLRQLELYVYDKHPRAAAEGTCLCSVELDAPSLECIELEDQINSIFIQKGLAFLEEANIQLTPFEYDIEIPNRCDSFVEAFHAIGFAKSLNLSDEVIRALSCATIKMSTSFNRLTRLEVLIDSNYWSSLQDFIKLSDNLEVLIVNKYCGYSTEGDHFNNSNWKKLDVVPRCLSKSLRTVSIGAYDGYPDELAMIYYIIKHGSVLEIMQICFGETISDFKRKYELLREISAIPRKSSVCEVKFGDNGSEHNAL